MATMPIPWHTRTPRSDRVSGAAVATNNFPLLLLLFGFYAAGGILVIRFDRRQRAGLDAGAVTSCGVGVIGMAIDLPLWTAASKSSVLAEASTAESAQRPLGFADLVEKVKPAVISVRAKTETGPE